MTATTGKPLFPALQFLILIVLAFAIVMVGNLIALAIIATVYNLDLVISILQLDTSKPNAVNALWILQVVGTTLPLAIAPLIFAKTIVKDTGDYLKPGFKFPWQLLLLVFCIAFISAPLIELLSSINQKMVLPDFLKGLEKWMRDSENRAQKLVALLLKMDSVGDMITKVIFIGLFTAIVEELMFRGCIQTIFTRWTKNGHAAVWITAILFSAFHMEFFGFLPRLLLGALFGYFTLWSGSIWPAVWGHFINNGTAVVVTYLYQHNKTKINPDSQHIFNYAAYLFSLIIVLFLLYLYRNVALIKKPHSTS